MSGGGPSDGGEGGASSLPPASGGVMHSCQLVPSGEEVMGPMEIGEVDMYSSTRVVGVKRYELVFSCSKNPYSGASLIWTPQI